MHGLSFPTILIFAEFGLVYDALIRFIRMINVLSMEQIIVFIVCADVAQTIRNCIFWTVLMVLCTNLSDFGLQRWKKTNGNRPNDDEPCRSIWIMKRFVWR